MLMACHFSFAQQPDSSQKEMTFSGSIGITNKAFSIIPLFSLNSPPAIFLLSWRKNRFSIESDIRLALDARKGNLLFWFRYRLIDKQKFSLRVGIHPVYFPFSKF